MRRFSVRPRRAGAIRLLVLAGLSIVALTLTSSGFAVVHLDHQSAGLRDFDARGKVAPTKAQLRAARSIHGRVSWSPLGTPASIIHYGGYLAAGLKAPSAGSAARNWLAAHKAAFGLGSVTDLRLLTAAPLRGSKALAVSFRQTFGGVLSADGVVTVTVVPAKTGWKVVYASSSLARDQAVRGKRSLSPVRAWIKAASAAGIHVSDVAALGKTADGATALSASGLSGFETVRPTVFGTAARGAIRAYDTTVTRSVNGSQDSYRVIVDGATGKLLYRQNLVDNLADDPVWSAFPIAPPFDPLNAFPWNYPSTDTRQTYCWTATAGCTNVVSDDPLTTVYPMGVASKFQWDIPLSVAGVQSTPQSTVGNNVDEALLWSGGGRSYNNPANPRPISGTRDYTAANFPFTNQWFTSGCNPAPLIATGQAGAQANPNVEDWSAAAINLFVGHNRMHDYSYYLGWDEGHWNAQQFNNGVATPDPTPIPGGPTATPLGNDAIMGQSQDGAISGGPPGYAARDNANMGTGADGSTRRRTCSSGSRCRVRSTPRASTATTTSPSSRTSSVMRSRTA